MVEKELPARMRAVVIEQYGEPELLRVAEVARPAPRKGQALVRVRATAVNDYDWCLTRGKPRLYRLFFGLTRPRSRTRIPGMELAGTVEAVGEGVTRFRKGDEVYGDTSDYGFGSFAEYVCTDERALTKKPRGRSFEEAASIPHAAMLAWQGLGGAKKIGGRGRILINGAGGGVGMLALQIAKLHGAEVTGVDTGEKLKAMERLGFDHVIDYRKDDFAKNGQRYDLILDTKSTRSPFACARSLEPGGSYITVGGQIRRLLGILCWGAIIYRASKKRVRVASLKPNRDLEDMHRFFATKHKKIECVIDGPYTLDEAPKAIRRFGEGRHTGKVVISVQGNSVAREHE